MLRELAAISKSSKIADYNPLYKLTAFLLPPIILSFDREGLSSSLINLGVSLLIVRKLEISFKIYARFLKGISLFLLLGTVPVILEGGIYSGAVLIFRGISSISSIYLFSATTPIDDVFYIMNKHRATREMAEIGKNMMRFIFTVEDEFIRVKKAMDSRNGFIGWRNKTVNTGKVAGAVFRGILKNWKETEEVLKSRGYTGKTVFLEVDYRRSKLFMISAILYNVAIASIIILK